MGETVFHRHPVLLRIFAEHAKNARPTSLYTQAIAQDGVCNEQA